MLFFVHRSLGLVLCIPVIVVLVCVYLSFSLCVCARACIDVFNVSIQRIEHNNRNKRTIRCDCMRANDMRDCHVEVVSSFFSVITHYSTHTGVHKYTTAFYACVCVSAFVLVCSKCL